jgi:phage FluMu gp28-like protein
MATAKTTADINRDLADKLVNEARNTPKFIYAGKFVGIVNGQVVAVADDWDELAARLHAIEPDPAKTFGVEIGRDYDVVEKIWTHF